MHSTATPAGAAARGSCARTRDDDQALAALGVSIALTDAFDRLGASTRRVPGVCASGARRGVGQERWVMPSVAKTPRV